MFQATTDIQVVRVVDAGLGPQQRLGLLVLLDERGLVVRPQDRVPLKSAKPMFRDVYNATWLIERHGFRPPAAVRAAQLPPAALAA